MSIGRYSWTQPVCGSCFQDMNPGRVPTRLKHAEEERCCHCGEETSEGIYVRVDPTTVAHPTRLKP